MSPFAFVKRLLGGGKIQEADRDAFQFDYQPEVDLLFAWVGEPQAARNVEVEPGVYVRVLPSEHRVVGIEILGCAARTGRPKNEIDDAFARRLLRQYTPAALSRL